MKLLQYAFNKLNTNKLSSKYPNSSLVASYIAHIYMALLGQNLKSKILPFLPSFEIFNQNVYNYVVHSGTSSNIMPFSVHRKKKKNATPLKSIHIKVR